MAARESPRNFTDDRSVSARDEPFSVVLAADDRYSMQLATTIQSVVANHSGALRENPLASLDIYILENGISATNKERIIKGPRPSRVKVHWIALDASLLRDLPDSVESGRPRLRYVPGANDFLSVTTYAKLFIPEYLPSTVSKALYLDSDLVVTRALEELWAMDFDGNYVLAVRDEHIGTVSAPSGISNYEKLGLDAEQEYFNAGVLMLNLEKWRADEIGRKAVTYARENAQYLRFGDQDSLNVVIGTKWKRISDIWNYQPRFRLFRLLSEKPAIVHFAGSQKPWLRGTRHPYLREYYKYVDQTDWRGWRPPRNGHFLFS